MFFGAPASRLLPAYRLLLGWKGPISHVDPCPAKPRRAIPTSNMERTENNRSQATCLEPLLRNSVPSVVKFPATEKATKRWLRGL
jgi:hypothetical protein